MKQIITLIIFVLSFQLAQAGSYLAGGLSYKITTVGEVKFTFQYVRDCAECPLLNCGPSDLELTIGQTTNTYQWTLDTVIDLTPDTNCISCNRCQDTSCKNNSSMQLLQYTTVADVSSLVPSNCNAIAEVSADGLAAIPHIQSTNSTYHKLSFDACLKNTNHSRLRFANLLETAQDYSSWLGYNAPSTDSLYYEMVPVKESPSKNVTYLNGYSHAKPMKYYGFPNDFNQSDIPRGIHFNKQNANIFFRPMINQRALIRVKSTQYRAGKVLSTGTFDYYFDIFPWPDNNPPVISGMNCSSPIAKNYDTTVVAGSEICFDICTTDRDRDDSVEITWNQGIKAGIFTVNDSTAKRWNARFCWTPDSTHAANPFPYRFVISAKDQGCPNPSFAARTFSIKVVKKSSSIGSAYNDQKVAVYPNPAQEAININNQNGDFSRVDILAISGKIHIRHTLTRGLNTVQIDDLADGIYFLHFQTTNGQSAWQKLVVQ